MISSIIYKEYIKTHKIIYIFLAILAISIFMILINAKNAFEFGEATSAILKVSLSGRFSFNYIDRILPIFGIALGVAQFYPEVSNARIRLYLHLPMSTFKLVSALIIIGFLFLIFVFLLVAFFYNIELDSYYPSEVFCAILTKLYPIFLTTLLCYATTVLAFLEPKNKRKILYIAISYFILDNYTNYTHVYFMSEYLDNIIWVIIGVYVITIYNVFDVYTKGYIK